MIHDGTYEMKRVTFLSSSPDSDRAMSLKTLVRDTSLVAPRVVTKYQ